MDNLWKSRRRATRSRELKCLNVERIDIYFSVRIICFKTLWYGFEDKALYSIIKEANHIRKKVCNIGYTFASGTFRCQLRRGVTMLAKPGKNCWKTRTTYGKPGKIEEHIKTYYLRIYACILSAAL